MLLLASLKILSRFFSPLILTRLSELLLLFSLRVILLFPEMRHPSESAKSQTIIEVHVSELVNRR